MGSTGPVRRTSAPTAPVSTSSSSSNPLPGSFGSFGTRPGPASPHFGAPPQASATAVLPPLPGPAGAAPLKPAFPSHNAPRIWFIASIASPVALYLARVLLAHGDYIVGGTAFGELSDARWEQFRAFREDLKADTGADSPPGAKRMIDRFAWIRFDKQSISNCQSGLAHAVSTFGRIDILVCPADSVFVGAVEEAVQADPTLSIFRDSFESIFLGNVNLIKSALPIMRFQNTGHIIVLSSTSSHSSLPCLGVTNAAHWALEGWCDSLAYECAPFNIRISMIHPSFETQVLTSKITTAPSLPDLYSPSVNPAGKARQTVDSIIGHLSGSCPATTGSSTSTPTSQSFRTSRPPAPTDPSSPRSRSSMSPNSRRLLDRSKPVSTNRGGEVPFLQVPSARLSTGTPTTGSVSSSVSPGIQPVSLLPKEKETVTTQYPALQSPILQTIVSETVFAIASIGGHDNPPLHHFVGHESSMEVREKEKLINLDISAGAMLFASEGFDYGSLAASSSSAAPRRDGQG